MALFKVARGMRSSLDEQPLHDGYAYFCIDDGTLHIDYTDANGIVKRKQINAQEAEMLGLHPVEDFLLKEDLKGSFATGENTTASGVNSSAEGKNTIASGLESHAEGDYTQAKARTSHAEGGYTIASGNDSHAEGSSTIASGRSSHAEGSDTKANGSGSHAEGGYTIAKNYYSHAEGDSTQANGVSSHAEGYDSRAEGGSSHAEGSYTIASDTASHAEGNNTKAIGSASHAEGYDSRAEGYSSHSEGQGTAATASQSHAEGYLTNATGEASHAEGNGTIASEHASHAGGWASKANAIGSFAHGNCVTADADYQAAFGTYNEVNTDAAFIVGNGNETTKSNAFEVNKDGNTYTQKSLFVGGTGNNKSKAKEVATLDTLRITTRQMTNALKGSKSGEAIAISDASPVTHEMEIKISSDTVTDLTKVKVKRCGKNIVNIPTIDINGGNGTIPCYITKPITISGINDNVVVKNDNGVTADVWRIQVVYADGTTGEMMDSMFSSSKTFKGKNKPSVDIPITAINYRNIYIRSGKYKNIQVEYGTTATDYEPYIGKEYTPNADGTVNGVTSLYPNTTLTTDTEGIIIDCTYNRDINKAFAELQQAIISLGGNV